MLLAALVATVTLTGCDAPPQIVDIAPDRNASQVPSNAAVSIRFDRPVDRPSVEKRFSIRPEVTGQLSWAPGNRLVFRHEPFRAGTTYWVRLEPGYGDLHGHRNQLAHSWSFVSEPPPVITGWSPGSRRDVDTSAYVVLQFNREMDLASLQGSVSISPHLPVTVRRDPGDARRAVVAPATLLDPVSTYSVTVTSDARDVDGNPLAAGKSMEFTTGPQRPLRHWVTFLASDGVAGAGIWIVDENRLPRRITAMSADSFAWSPDETRLLVRTGSRTWYEVAVGGGQATLPFQADWAARLASDRGYAYLEGETLRIVAPSGATTVVDRNVSSATVSPDGQRLAYVAGPPGAHGANGTEIRGYAVELRAHYRFAIETDAVDGLAWSPDGSRLAYRVLTADAVQSVIRVKNLLGSGTTLTVAMGEVDAPRWQADSRHVILSATVGGAGPPRSRLFRLPTADVASRPLTAADALPTPPGVDVRDPMPSPDGHQVAFLQSTAGGDQVWVMNVDGSGFAPLTAFDLRGFPYSCRAPAWTRA